MSYDVMTYGAYNDGTHPEETTAAFQQAITLAKNHGISGGKVVFEGNFLVNQTLDLRTEKSIQLVGEGKYGSIISSIVDGAPSIIWGGPTNKYTRIAGFMLRQNFGDGLSRPRVDAQVGIAAPFGTGYGGEVEHVWIDGFPSDAITVNGDTGPTVFRDLTLQTCNGRGIVLIDSPQNVTIERGSIQMMRGGVQGIHVTALAVRDCDIELGDHSTHAAFDLDGASAGCMLVGGAISARGPIDVGAVVRIAGFGNRVDGGINFAGAGLDNILLDGPSCQRNVITSGYYAGSGASNSGFFARVLGGIYNRFDTPFLVDRNVPTSSYIKHRDGVYDVSYPWNYSQCFGVRMVNGSDTIGMINTMSPITQY